MYSSDNYRIFAYNKKKQKMRRTGNHLYPINFKGKEMYKDDCDRMFATYYTCVEALGVDQSVYAFDGIRVKPDGTLSEIY